MDQPISLEKAVDFLVSRPLFDGLDPSERAEVVRIMGLQRLTDGEAVFHEGDPGDAWYVIFEGQARVLKDVNGRTSDLATLEPGACFGEMAILDGQARSATVQADGPLTVFRFRQTQFEQLLDQGSLAAYKLVLAMARMLSQRHRQLTRQLAESAATAELVAAGTSEREATGPFATTTAAQYQISE